jgi:plasmid stabilization system protein ParE
MIKYRFLTPAEEEMNDAASFYEDALVGLGRTFLDDLQHAIVRVCQYPELGSKVEPDLRRILLQRFPFSLVYAVEPESVLIVAVAHHGRMPAYWRSRIDR